ncbi:MAG: carbohydrate ABC transporter permease [Chloroflexi bacterium]|nr:carbohydrate ABC transporter permease [Chloroflexota bacterium]
MSSLKLARLTDRSFTLILPLALLTLFALFPFWWMIVTSIRPTAEMHDLTKAPLWTFNPTGEHYQELLSKMSFLTWLKNSIIVAVVSTGVSLLLGVLGGYSLSRLHFRGGGLLGVLVVITYLVPTTLLFLPLAYVVQWLGLFSSIGSLLATYPTFLVPFTTWYLMGYLSTIPREMEEAALIDGCSRLQSMLFIAVPLALPGLISAGIFAFTLSWNEFVYALTFIQSDSQKTVPVGVVGALSAGDVFFWGKLMAAAVLGSLPVALLYGALADHFVAGLTAGAVKS